MPRELVELYYSSLNEKAQLKAIRVMFESYEKEPAAIALAVNLVE
jgi:hypothetical protein